MIQTIHSVIQTIQTIHSVIQTIQTIHSMILLRITISDFFDKPFWLAQAGNGTPPGCLGTVFFLRGGGGGGVNF